MTASVYSALLKRLGSKDGFLLRLVTVDETWVHYYELENKAQSRQWVGPGSPMPKKFKNQPSAGKVMATVFFEHKGRCFYWTFYPREVQYSANLLDQLKNAICERRLGKLYKVVLLQQDNANVHTCKVAMDDVDQNGYELIPHLYPLSRSGS